MVQVERVITIFFEDPEASIACFSGSLTDSLVHPQKRSQLFAYLVKTTVVGLFLATFVSPAFHERFKLTKNEAIAASFVWYSHIKCSRKILRVHASKENSQTSGQLN